MSDSVALARITQAHRLLAEAKDLTDIKAVKDMAEAARLYARARNLGIDTENAAAQIKVRAERKLGETLAETEKNHGAATPQRGAPGAPRSQPPTLAEIGISKKESSNAQAVAAIPEPAFEALVTETIEAGKPLTTKPLVREGRQHQRRRVDAMLDSIPDPGDAHRRAKVKRAYSSAVLNVMQGFMTIDPTITCEVLDLDARSDLRRFIGSLRARLDVWETAMQHGLYAVGE